LLYTQKFAEHFEHKIVLCLYCGFVYVNSIPSDEYYDEYYRDQSKYEGTRQHEIHAMFTFDTIKYVLKKYILKNANILDVGCSTGALLNLIKTQGYTNLLGIEPAPECKQIAKKKYNVDVITSTLDNFKKTGRYDLIIYSAVLEHLAELRATIIKSSSLLKDNGMIFIGVPDTENFYRKFEEPFGEFSTEHINFFTRGSLHLLMLNFENIFFKTDNCSLLSLWRKKSNQEININRYIDKSQKKMNHILQKIRSLPKNTIVWGVGALTQRLLKTTSIKSKVYKFVDSNKNLIGKKVGGISIISPNELKKYRNPVMISSFHYRNEIKKYILSKDYKNTIITFE